MFREGALGKEKEGLPKSRLFRFWELSEDNLQKLKEAVERSNGLIRLFVHPFVEGPEYHPHGSYARSVLIDNNEGLQRILQNESAKVPPVFIMEEEPRIDDTKNILSREFKPRKDVYIIPTHNSSPEPYFHGYHRVAGLQRDPLSQESWEQVIKKFKVLGVRKILLAGMYFDVGTRTFRASKAPPLPELKKVWGCAGGAAWALAEDFEIEISNLVFPNSRGEF